MARLLHQRARVRGAGRHPGGAGRRARGALRYAVLLALGLGACSRAPSQFSETNARKHVEMLAGTIGSRPIGSLANARAREYLVQQLREFGFDVSVREAEASRS